MKEQLEQIIKEVYQKKNRNLFTFLTGAGISFDSGIPTYRGTDGIWVKGTKFHKPEEFGTFEYFKENPEEVWQYSLLEKKCLKMHCQTKAILNWSKLKICCKTVFI